MNWNVLGQGAGRRARPTFQLVMRPPFGDLEALSETLKRREGNVQDSDASPFSSGELPERRETAAGVTSNGHLLRFP